MAKRCDREGMRKIVHRLAALSAKQQHSPRQFMVRMRRLLLGQKRESTLDEVFSREWPTLEQDLRKLPPEFIPIGDLMVSGTAPLYVVFGGTDTRRSEPGEVNALAGLLQTINQSASEYVKERLIIYMGQKAAPRNLASANIVSIGGPCVNEHTKSIMQTGPIQYREQLHQYSVGTQQYANSGQANAEGIFEDHAVMMRVPNPYCPSKVAVALGGLSSRATEGCIHVISDGSRELDCYSSGQPFAAIVRTIHKDNQFVSAEVVWHEGLR
jgi:hypothetical protein